MELKCNAFYSSKHLAIKTVITSSYTCNSVFVVILYYTCNSVFVVLL